MHLHQMEGKVEKLLARPLTADTKFIVCGQRPTAKHKKLSSNALFVKNVGTKEPWSSGYGRRLVFLRSWIRIPAPYTGWS